jgi:hypothetical protein
MDTVLQNMPPSVVFVLVLSGLAWGGLLLYMIREIVGGRISDMDRRISDETTRRAEEYASLVADLSGHKLHVSENYVRREAFIKAIERIDEHVLQNSQYQEQQLDKINLKLERLVGGAQNG